MIHNGSFVTKTDKGKIRLSNDDSVGATINSAGDIFLCVCDGMGGYKSGDFASNLALNDFKEAFVNHGRFFTKIHIINFFSKVLRNINKTIYEYAEKKDFKSMGTTFCAALIINKYLIIINVGDSRCYFYSKKNGLELKTTDDTYVNYLYKQGKITKEETLTHEKRHVLTNALGMFPNVVINYEFYKYDNQNIFLCSDGLYNQVSNNDIEAVLLTKENVDIKAEILINLAKDNGGSDNIAVAIWEGRD